MTCKDQLSTLPSFQNKTKEKPALHLIMDGKQVLYTIENFSLRLISSLQKYIWRSIHLLFLL